MSNDDVNAVVLRLARTLQRCGEDPRVVFAALIGAAATIAADLGEEVSTPADLRRAIDAVVDSGHLEGFRDDAPGAAALNAVVVPFRPAKVA
ncbi:hypothetical protein [Methylopila turkensis]|uniref:Uncharacterized protein n=1 Tax=Methylopila turkensis TaxID=1437816 RepID=A0A9W6N6A3_9HYPH|nr:hypothetical protein [Methylopila turkensis]GLK79258.1 hypothetical protein GCM10008174_09990 [Methylopila turkensis]